MAKTLVEVALGDIDLSLDNDQQTWTDWTAHVEVDGTAGVQWFRGYRDGSLDPSATEIRFRGKNTSLRWSIDNPNNPEFGRIIKGRTLIRVSRVDGGTFVQATAILAEVILAYDAGGAYQYADVTAYGRFEREENQPEGRSPTYRQLISNSNLVYYVPGEDPAGSTRLRQAVKGQPDVTTVVDVQYAADGEVDGSDPLWTLSATGNVRGTVAPYPRKTPEQWTFYFTCRPTEPAGATPFYSILTPGGTIASWTFSLTPGTPGTFSIVGANSAGVQQLTGTTSADLIDSEGLELFGRPLAFSLTVAQNGADIDWTIATNLSGGQTGTVTGQTLGPVTGYVIGPNASIDGWTFGQFALINDDFGALVSWDGYNGEDTWLRWFTATLQMDMPIAVGASTATTTTMGPMRSGRPIDIAKQAVRSEGGLMYERADGAARFLMRSDLQNQTVALTINRTGTPRPIKNLYQANDSIGLVNQVTASTEGGDSVTVDAPYPRTPALVGWTRPGQLDVGVDTADQVRQAAEFDVMERSYQDSRYIITLALDGPASGIKATYLSAVDIGKRINITNPQGSIALDTIDQHVMGIEGRMTEHEFEVTLNTRPAGPWQVATAETGAANLSRADTAGSVLLAALANGATSAIVATNGNPGDRTTKWSTTALPYDLALRTFDRATCTAVTNNACTFVAAGTAAHADNAAVTPGTPAGLTVGDVVFLFSSIRDSTGEAWLSGVADTSAIITGDQLGWKSLVEFGGLNGSMTLYGTQYSAAFAAPTLTPQQGVAGDTVSARMVGFRYAQPLAHTRAIPLANASAANIAYPGLGIVRANTLVLLVVQKDDDASTFSTPAGFTAVGLSSSTAGSDQSIAIYYQIQTTATNVQPGTITVTGGAAATSKATVISLCTDAQTLTLTRAVNGATSVPAHPAGSDVRLWRAGRVGR